MTRNDSIDLFTGQGLGLIEVNPLKLNHSTPKQLLHSMGIRVWFKGYLISIPTVFHWRLR